MIPEGYVVKETEQEVGVLGRRWFRWRAEQLAREHPPIIETYHHRIRKVGWITYEVVAFQNELVKEAGQMCDAATDEGQKPDPILPIVADENYTFDGATLERMLFEVGGAVSAVFMREQKDLVMPSEECKEAIQAWAIESAAEFREAYDKAKERE